MAYHARDDFSLALELLPKFFNHPDGKGKAATSGTQKITQQPTFPENSNRQGRHDPIQTSQQK